MPGGNANKDVIANKSARWRRVSWRQAIEMPPRFDRQHAFCSFEFRNGEGGQLVYLRNTPPAVSWSARMLDGALFSVIGPSSKPRKATKLSCWIPSPDT